MGCATSSKVIQVREVGGMLGNGVEPKTISTRGFLSGNKVSLFDGKQPNLLFYKGLR